MVDFSEVFDICLSIWSSFQDFASPVFDTLTTTIKVPYASFDNLIGGVLPTLQYYETTVLKLSLGAGIFYFFAHMFIKWLLDIFP